MVGQKVHNLAYNKVYYREEFNLPILSHSDSNKIVILIFTKDSYGEDNKWLNNIEYENTLDTSHFVFFRIKLPVICDTTPTLKRINFGGSSLYSFPDHTVQKKFQVIIQANNNSMEWAMKKLSYNSNFFVPLPNNPPKNTNTKKQKPPIFYNISDLKTKNDFIYLVTKSPEYSSFENIKSELEDSLYSLKK